MKVALVAAGAPNLPQGKAFYHPSKGLVFYPANLPALPSNQTYQLWLVPGQGSPISAGVLSYFESEGRQRTIQRHSIPV